MKNNKINGLMKVFYPNGQIRTEKMFENGEWDGQEYREYAEQGNLVYEVSYDGYSTKYYKVDDKGQKVPLDDVEQKRLIDRINVPTSVLNGLK